MQAANDKLQITRTSQLQIAAGLFPLFGGTIFLLVSVVLWIAPEVEWEARILFLLISLVPLSIGIFMTFGRSAAILDRENQMLIRWWGLLRPMRTATTSLHAMNRVELAVTRGGRSNRARYRVRLGGDQPRVEIYAARTEVQARRIAEQAAQFLQLELHDLIEPASFLDQAARPVVHRPEEIGITVSERSGPQVERANFPRPPAALQAEVQTTPQAASITVPAQGLSGPLLMIAAAGSIPALFLLLVVPAAIRQFNNQVEDTLGSAHDIHGTFAWVVTGAGVLYCLLFGLFMYKCATAKVYVRMTRDTLNVRGGLWQMTFAMDRIVEVRVDGKGGNWATPCHVLVRSAGQLVRIGGNTVSREEGEYWAALIEHFAKQDSPQQSEQPGS